MLTICNNQSLKPYNTFNVNSTAHFFCDVHSNADIQQLLHNTAMITLPKLIIGGGSNLLFTQNFPGLVIKNSIKGITVTQETEAHIWLTIGSGENWHDTVMYCIEHDYAGLENLSLIPGSVGAAPVQNIGAYGVELESVFDSLEAIELSSGTVHYFDKADCQFGYRNSIFKNELKGQFIITSVTLRLNKKAKLHLDYGNINMMLDHMGITTPTIKDVSHAVIAIRQQKLPDPKKLPNAGSFFKNPTLSSHQLTELETHFSDIPHYPQSDGHIKIPAAWLIDQCQLKGYKENGVGISPNHALVIVNYSNPDGAAVKHFSEKVQHRVADKFGIQLEPEVNIY